MPSFALAAIGRDRPGIVAAVSKVLYEQGCNIEDSSMTLLRGNFAIMLVLASPEGTTAGDLENALRPACEQLGLTASVLEVTDEAVVASPTHMLTVYGADHPGILYRITDTLAAEGVNITDLVSRLVGAPENAVYALMLELALPEGLDPNALDATLQGLADQVGVDVTLRPLESDVL